MNNINKGLTHAPASSFLPRCKVHVFLLHKEINIVSMPFYNLIYSLHTNNRNPYIRPSFRANVTLSTRLLLNIGCRE